MTLTIGILLGVLVAILAAVAAVVAWAETAFIRVNQTRADALAAAEIEDHEDPADRNDRVFALQRFARRPLTTLASLVLVRALSHVSAVGLGWAIGRAVSDGRGGIVGASIAFISVLAAIVIARGRAMVSSDAAAVRSVPVLTWLAPFGVLTVGLMRWVRRSSPSPAPDPDVDEQQVLAIVGEATAIDHDEEVLFQRVAAFDDTVVGDIMTPRTDLVTLRSGFAVGDALEVASLHGLSRIPVTGPDSDIDDLLGAVHVKDLIVAHIDGRTKHDIDVFLREPPIVPETQQISNLLTHLQAGRFHMAIVVDEYGGVAGVVTLEDILEELVGEIEDEFDPNVAHIERLGPNAAKVDGRAELDEVDEALGISLPPGDYRTIAGCFFSRFGRVPEVGDVLELDDIRLEVLRMQGRRIADIEVRFTHANTEPGRD